jgi:hypothetical protein
MDLAAGYRSSFLLVDAASTPTMTLRRSMTQRTDWRRDDGLQYVKWHINDRH